VNVLLVTCVDGHIRGAIETLEAELGIAGCDRLQVPGGPLALVTEGHQQRAMTDWLELLSRFKDVAVVHLVSHQHCLAYQRKLGGFFADEREVLERDLNVAKRVIEGAVYGVRVECHLVPWFPEVDGGEYGLPVSVV
jgi:hypothetical protein